MFFLLQEGHAAPAAEHGAPAAGQGAEAAHAAAAQAHHAEHVPPVVQWINHAVGEPVHQFELHYTKPLWDKFFGLFHTNAEAVFGPYTPENAIPWYTVMFVIACVLTVIVVLILRKKLSLDAPHGGQQTLEVAVLSIRGLLADVVGEHGLKYFPVVATFAILILISNLMGFFPMFMSPTAATSVTFALGLSSFLYYNAIGVKENGVFGHLRHFMGPVWWLAPLIFFIEIVGNLIRPLSLGLRLFGNMFADEQVVANIAGIYPPLTGFATLLLMPLGLFVAVVQTFVFTLLSMVYISEVSHPPHHGEHRADGHGEEVLDTTSDNMIAPVMG
jgi:F-type H+-transporting ATPase subunit a